MALLFNNGGVVLGWKNGEISASNFNFIDGIESVNWPVNMAEDLGIFYEGN